MTNLEAMLQALKVLSGCLEHPDAQDAITALRLAIEHEDSTPPRKWVGLTDEEIQSINNKVASEFQTGQTYARAIEAKIKEKNNAYCKHQTQYLM